ncbi:uncharacterized protein DUF1837 [Novosphingobium sp. PhB55]|nr:uncharacterized protein DUF1837 [Novosphingobium sp. PhB55]
MKQLPTQLGDPEAVKAVLKHAAFTIALESGDEVQAMAMYLPAMDGKSSYDQFFELIKNGILENFVFSCTEIQKKTGSNRKIDAEELLQKALRKLSRHTAKGELGELILFTLLDVYLGAPKLLSKVSMKTNPRMPVYGADAVHGQFHDGAFRLYLGESKLQKDFKAAAKKAATSISSAKAKYDDEFDLLDSYIDFPNIDDETESEILSILNPFSESHQADIVHSPCFIGFTNPILIATDGGFDKFLNAYNLIAKEHFKEFYDQIREYGLPANESVLLILPFTCVDNLVDEFVEYMGIEN